MKPLNRKISISLLVILLGLSSGCSSTDTNTGVLSRANPEDIQEALRTKAYANWDQKFFIGSSESERSTVGFDTEVSLEKPPIRDDSAPSGVDINAWRAEISEPWSEVPDDKFVIMCRLWFDWLLDPSQVDGNIGQRFTLLRQNLKQMSLVPYAYDQVSLIQDNRKTIPYPRENMASYLLICRAEVTFETTFGVFNRSYVYLSARYELRDGKATFIFPSYSSKNID